MYKQGDQLFQHESKREIIANYIGSYYKKIFYIFGGNFPNLSLTKTCAMSLDKICPALYLNITGFSKKISKHILGRSSATSFMNKIVNCCT